MRLSKNETRPGNHLPIKKEKGWVYLQAAGVWQPGITQLGLYAALPG